MNNSYKISNNIVYLEKEDKLIIFNPNILKPVYINKGKNQFLGYLSQIISKDIIINKDDNDLFNELLNSGVIENKYFQYANNKPFKNKIITILFQYNSTINLEQFEKLIYEGFNSIKKNIHSESEINVIIDGIFSNTISIFDPKVNIKKILSDCVSKVLPNLKKNHLNLYFYTKFFDLENYNDNKFLKEINIILDFDESDVYFINEYHKERKVKIDKILNIIKRNNSGAKFHVEYKINNFNQNLISEDFINFTKYFKVESFLPTFKLNSNSSLMEGISKDVVVSNLINIYNLKLNNPKVNVFYNILFKKITTNENSCYSCSISNDNKFFISTDGIIYSCRILYQAKKYPINNILNIKADSNLKNKSDFGNCKNDKCNECDWKRLCTPCNILSLEDFNNKQNHITKTTFCEITKSIFSFFMWEIMNDLQIEFSKLKID